jgi:hypothetical protein
MSNTPNNQENTPKEAPKPQPTTTKLNHTPAASSEETGVARFDGGIGKTADFSKD